VATAYVALGSNIAPEKHISLALAELAVQCRVAGISRFYRSRPLNRPEQADFINGACRVETELPPRELKFDVLREIEQRLGRVRSADAYAARTIDLDILLYGELVVDEVGLMLPDPDICHRPFLFLPLLDLDRNLTLPGEVRLLREMVRGAETHEAAVDVQITNRIKEQLCSHD
jgi:2-amino-4-hydroxy-6-hydroxymethyldihydropteridine diphosphokinase